MYIQQIYTNCLSQASYYIESEGVSAIIDPMRDVDSYVKIAAQRNAKIRYVFLTHFHADFVSGHLDLAEKTQAIIVLGPNAAPKYPAFIAKDGERLKLGDCEIEVLHTPGHTIESSCFLLYGENKFPLALFSGDTLFIGDVGRPDLLSGNLDAEDLARMLYDSIQAKIKTLPDEVIVYPGHGPGSACGKNLGKETVSTIGDQKRTNYAMTLNREDFIEAVTTDQPFAPAYFFQDAWINMNGYSNLEVVLNKSLKPLTPEQFKKEIQNDTIVVDTRNAEDFAKGFIKGAINIGLDGQFASWVGTLVNFDHSILLLADEGKETEAITRLARIGYEKVTGYLKGGMTAWKEANGDTDSIRSVSIDQWKASESGHSLLDVRRIAEFDKEHLSAAIHIPLEQLQARITGLDKKKFYAIYCAGGYRSMIAVSILRRAGFVNTINITGGITAVKQQHPELINSH
jgi:glyoxylase-like metal-dependent hydrolase (beta-lactamase superfamily II)/rhodanese-related sulfurtransferase